MQSFNFPHMLNNTSADMVTDYYATLSNLKALLASDKYALLGDPYYGTNLKRLLYSQNNILLRDLVIDDIFNAIVTFMPQVKISRNDIVITQVGTQLFAKINAVNLSDYTNNLYEINLTANEE